MKTANLRQLHRSLLELTDLTKISKDLKRRGPSYSLFHIHLADTRSHADTLKNVLVSQTDEDRAYFAESLSDTILRITDLKDAIWFRKGVLRKETLGLTNSARHRDHSVHTLHNYLLGWYFFVHGKTIRDEFTSAFKGRGFSYTNAYGFSLAFGELWCFASLLHDVGYLFEGQVPEGSMALVDEGMRAGAAWVSEYFQEIFWDECKLRRADDRNEARCLAGFEAQWLTGGGPGVIVQFLRDLGSLESVTQAIAAERELELPAKLPSDAFQLWKVNYAGFGIESMAERIERFEQLFYSLFERDVARSPRVLDHGVCSGLLLLKYSTAWFRFIFALKQCSPPEGSERAKLRERLLSLLDPDDRYNATHWWKSVIWATAATAIHNVQQKDHSEGSRKLDLGEDPLAYLGILVDVLHRPSSRRILTVESDVRRISSVDVQIGRDHEDKIHIRYGCRDDQAARREEAMRKDLDGCLVNWDKLVDISFYRV